MTSIDKASKPNVPDLTRKSPELRGQTWKGTRLVPATEKARQIARSAVAQAGTSYMISNRTTDDLGYAVPIAGGLLDWFMSTVQSNDPTPSDYSQVGSSSSTAPSAFVTSIAAALKQQSNQLVVFVHGLGNLFDDAIAGTAALGTSLAGHGSYPGLVIGFDWPSYDETDSGLWYASSDSFPPTATSGTIRDNINGSVAAFANLIAFLDALKSDNSSLTISLVCHSEGNYMALVGFWQNSWNFTFDHILMLAGDVNNAVLQQKVESQPLIGQGSYIANGATDVTVYFTTNDDVLPISAYMYQYDYHNLMFGGRLGSVGPDYNQGSQISNTYTVDCSAVINVANYQTLTTGKYIPATSLHSSYLYIPQIAADMSRVFQGTSPADVPNRSAVNDPNAYLMDLNNSDNEPMPRA